MAGEEFDFYDWDADPEFDPGSQPPSEQRPADEWGFEDTFGDTEAEPIAADVVEPTVVPEATGPAGGEISTGSRLKDRIITVSAVGAIILTGLFALGESGNGNGHKKAPRPVVAACDPTLGALKQVDTVFSGHHIADDPEIAARATGLHVVQNNLAYDFGAGTYGAAGVQQLVAQATTDLKPYGITFQVGSGYEHPDGIDFRNPTPAELQQNLSTALAEATEPLPEMPLELVRLTGINKIVMMADSSPNSDQFWQNGRTVFWNIDEQPNYPAMGEAMYYGLDRIECPDEQGQNDPAYAALNGRNVYVLPLNHAGLLALDQFARDGDWLQNGDVQAYVNQNDTAAESAANNGASGQYCSLIDGFMRRITVVDPGGFDNAAYDKDGIGGYLLDLGGDSIDSSLLDPASPILSSKAEFLLGRLDELDPRIVKYMATVNGPLAPSSKCAP